MDVTHTKPKFLINNTPNLIKGQGFDDLRLLDFYSLENFIKKEKGSNFKTDEEFQNYKRYILNEARCEKIDCEPIKITEVSPGKFKVIDGRQRFAASKTLGTIPKFEIV